MSNASESLSGVDAANMKVAEMKAFLDDHCVDYKDCVEKSDLRKRVEETLANPPKRQAKLTTDSSSSGGDGSKIGQEVASLLGDKLLGKTGKFNTTQLSCKIVALYFSAHWCPPCRAFTPVLRQLYMDSLKKQGIEIIFVSSDRDQAAFNGYYGDMPWLAIPFDNTDVRESLSSHFDVSGIPTMIVMDAKNGNVISASGREDVMNHKSNVVNFWMAKL